MVLRDFSPPQVRHIEAPQTKRTRELPQLVQTKGLGENVGVLPIHPNILKFDFTREDTLADKVVVHLNVLSPGLEDGVLRKLDATKVVIVYQCWLGHLHLLILHEPLKLYGFASSDNRSSKFGLSIRQYHCCYFLLHHAIIAFPKEKVYLEVDRRSPAFPPLSASV